MFKRGLFWTLIVFFALIVGVQAQDAGQPFAAVTGHSLSIFGLDAQPVSVSVPDNQGITSVVWSPDGSKLAFLIYDASFQPQLMLSDTSGKTPFKLDVGKLESGFPVTFTPDGHILYVEQASGNAGPTYSPTVKQIVPEEGAQPETLGSFAFQTGCGGGSPLPGDWIYWDETGFGGNRVTLEMTDAGVLHSTGCAGNGLALLDLKTGQDRSVGDVNPQNMSGGYGRAAVSPDGKQVAALLTTSDGSTITRSLEIIDLTTLNVTTVQTANQPDQVAWGTDGTLFYSMRSQKADLANTLTDAQKQIAGGETSIPSNEVQIRQVNPATGNDKVLYDADAYAIGRMEATADGSGLIFSQVANMDAWVKAIGDGSIDLTQDASGVAQRALVPISLFKLTLADGQVTRLGDNLAQFVLQPVTTM